MKNKSAAVFSKEETILIAETQKEIIELIASKTTKFTDDDEVRFKIVTGIIVFSICNLASSFGVKKPKEYMDDITGNVCNFYDIVKKNSSYMLYREGEKIDEGNFQ